MYFIRSRESLDFGCDLMHTSCVSSRWAAGTGIPEGLGVGVQKAGLAEKLFHDFRRTAVRNMTRAGVPRSIAMKISGHETESMFRRYDICNEDDLRQASEAVQKYHEAAQQKVVSIIQANQVNSNRGTLTLSQSL